MLINMVTYTFKDVSTNDLQISEAKTKRKTICTRLNVTMDKLDVYLEKIRGLLSMEHKDKKNIFYYCTYP